MNTIKAIHESKPTINPTNAPMANLKGLELVIAVGHEPGGGTSGERTWNTKVARVMKGMLESNGAKVHIYFHKIKSYGARQRALAAWIRINAPDAFICWELHYDAVKNKTVAGHHFKYRGAKELAQFTQEEWVQHYPQSLPRYDEGLHHATSGAGAGFLREMPCWAMLPEPFFNSNTAERAFFKTRINEIAFIYCVGAARFAKFKGK